MSYFGPNWMRSFLKNNKLSMKQATKLSIVLHHATFNPFTMYHFYDIVAKTSGDLEIGDLPELIWNADETTLPPKIESYVTKGTKTRANTYRN